jgi:hypothetical protein
MDRSLVCDASGNFSNAEFVIQSHDIGVVFTVTATGGYSGFTAVTYFTDVISTGTAANGDPGGFEIEGNLRASAEPESNY